MADPLTLYRAIPIGGADRPTSTSSFITARSDVDALAQAQARLGRLASFDLWQGERLVRHHRPVPPDAGGPPPPPGT